MSKMSFGEWLEMGIKEGFCTESICYSHGHILDVIPEFEAKFEECDDPCAWMVILHSERWADEED